MGCVMYILLIHGAADAGYIFDSAEKVWNCWDVQKRLGSEGDVDSFAEFERRLDNGEHLNIGLVLSIHKCVNCTPNGSCAALSAVRETVKIEAEARAKRE